MGWDTQIIIIVENIVNEEVEIAKHIFESDANPYFHNGISFIKYRECENGSKVLFFTYERRKYLPYWAIQEVSEIFNDKYFTVIGSSPEFILGPAGIVKILNGKIIDSYGFSVRFGEYSGTTDVLENPTPEVFFQCFGKHKLEESTREKYIVKLPKKWIEEQYLDNLLDFEIEEIEKFQTLFESLKDVPDVWEEIKLSSLDEVLE